MTRLVEWREVFQVISLYYFIIVSTLDRRPYMTAVLDVYVYKAN